MSDIPKNSIIYIMSQQKGKIGLAYASNMQTNTGIGKITSKHKASDQSNNICDFHQSPQQEPSQSPKHNSDDIYESILGEMAVESNRYISGLVATCNSNRLAKSLKKMKINDRKQSLANFAEDDGFAEFANMRGLKTMKINFSQKQENLGCIGLLSEPRSSHRQRGFELESKSKPKCFYQQQPKTAQKKQRKTAFSTNFDNSFDCQKELQPQFLAFLDGYVSTLSQHNRKPEFQIKAKAPNYSEKEHSKIAKKVQTYQKKFKQMQLSNHMEVKKMKKRQVLMLGKLQQLQEHIGALTEQLQNQREQRRRFQCFFNQFRKKLRMIKCPKKQPSGITSLSSKFSSIPQLYQFTQSDEIIDSSDQNECTFSFRQRIFSQNSRGNQASHNSDSHYRGKKINFFKAQKINKIESSTDKENLDWI